MPGTPTFNDDKKKKKKKKIFSYILTFHDKTP